MRGADQATRVLVALFVGILFGISFATMYPGLVKGPGWQDCSHLLPEEWEGGTCEYQVAER